MIKKHKKNKNHPPGKTGEVNMDAKSWKKIRKHNSTGQAIVEYIIIIAIIAVAALTILSIFSDRIRELIAGSASALGSNNAASEYDKGSSKEVIEKMNKDGVQDF
jgi:Flp pilus assembly pilin Flp